MIEIIKKADKETEHAILECMHELFRKNNREAAKVVITGSSDFCNYEFMEKQLDKLLWIDEFTGDRDIKIVTGMEGNADALARQYADEHELIKILFQAGGKSELPISLRNEDMMEIATHLIVFQTAKSHDTGFILDLAKAKGIPYKVFTL